MVKNGQKIRNGRQKCPMVRNDRWWKLVDWLSRRSLRKSDTRKVKKWTGNGPGKLKTDEAYLLIWTSIRIKFIWLFVEWKINMWNPISKLCQRRRLPRRCHFYHYQFLKVYGHFLSETGLKSVKSAFFGRKYIFFRFSLNSFLERCLNSFEVIQNQFWELNGLRGLSSGSKVYSYM